MRARLSLSLLALSFGFAVVGCGGNGSSTECKGAVTANAAYAGKYVITYTPNASSGKPTLTFNATVSGVASALGFINGTGTGTDGSALTIGADNGFPSFAGDDTLCDNLTYIKLDYRLTSADPVSEATAIQVTKKIDGTILGTYQASALIGSATQSSGTLTVTPAVQQ